jgi:selenocysteine lyase/cysteine desulfurase
MARKSAPHLKNRNVQDLGCDFYCYLRSQDAAGPMGIGVLWARRELLVYDTMTALPWRR